MNFTEYISTVSASDSVVAYIALGVFGFFAVSALLGLICGLTRGFAKAATRFLTVAVSVLVSFLVAMSLRAEISAFFAGKTLLEALSSVSPELAAGEDALVAFLSACDAATAEIIVQFVAGFIILPIVFVAVFLIVNIISLIVFWIISAIVKFKKYRRGAISRILGAVVGTVQGVVVAAIIFLPFSGYANLALDIRSGLSSLDLDEKTEEAIAGFYDEEVTLAIENPIFAAINDCGGEALLHEFALFDVSGTKVDAREELRTFIEIYGKTLALNGADFKNPTKENIDSLKDLADTVCQDPFTAEVISGVLRAFSNAIHSGDISLGLENPYRELAISITDIFIDTNGDTLGDNVNTIIEVYYILSDSGVLKALAGENADGVEDLLIAEYGEEGKNVINAVIDALKKNPATKPVVTSLTKLSVALLSTSLDMTGDATEVYEEVVGEVDTILNKKDDFATKEEYQESIATDLDAVLREYDIELEPEIIEDMAGLVAEKFFEHEGEITEDDINEALLFSYDAYAEYMKNGGGALPDGLPEDLIPPVVE